MKIYKHLTMFASKPFGSKHKTTSFTRSNTQQQNKIGSNNNLYEYKARDDYDQNKAVVSQQQRASKIKGEEPINQRAARRINTVKETSGWNASTNTSSYQSGITNKIDVIMRDGAELASQGNIISKLKGLTTTKRSNLGGEEYIYGRKYREKSRERPVTSTSRPTTSGNISYGNIKESVIRKQDSQHNYLNDFSNNSKYDGKQPHNQKQLDHSRNKSKDKTINTSSKASSSNYLYENYLPKNQGNIYFKSNAEATSKVEKDSSSYVLPSNYISGNSSNTYTSKSITEVKKKEDVKSDDNEYSNVNSLYYKKPSEKVYSSFNPSGKLLGLDNLGNTCFMNTSLQCLIHSKDFVIALNDEMQNNPPTKKNCPTVHFHKLLQSYNTGSSSIGPYEFKSNFSNRHSLFSGYQQHDSQEFCRFLLEDISMDLNRIKFKPKYEELKTDGKSKTELNVDYHKLFLKRENSIVVDYFYGQFCNTFTCLQCNLETYSYEKFLDIPILLNSTDYGSLQLSSLLKNHMKEENIQWGVKCEKCGQKSMHRKKSRISILPDFLIISFQRYDVRTNRKINSSISFSERFDFSQFADLECIRDNNTIYDLYAISNHSGSLHFGHYYAYVKVNDRWHEFNDSRVSGMGGVSTNSTSVYVLFYQKAKR